ncbi:MAG: hypothetical protein ACTSRP_10735 [Candidatus Helarchaeota archaeon]
MEHNNPQFPKNILYEIGDIIKREMIKEILKKEKTVYIPIQYKFGVSSERKYFFMARYEEGIKLIFLKMQLKLLKKY